jgi:hypothetical protein
MILFWGFSRPLSNNRKSKYFLEKVLSGRSLGASDAQGECRSDH